MAKNGKSSGIFYENVSNETGSPNPETPDMTGKDIYWGGFPEVLGKHLVEQSMVSTPNSESGDDILGKPTPGEPVVMKGK
jgi:hypothetical protein